jgi:hypothetical protein
VYQITICHTILYKYIPSFFILKVITAKPLVKHTCLIQTVCLVPSISVLERFNCIKTYDCLANKDCIIYTYHHLLHVHQLRYEVKLQQFLSFQNLKTQKSGLVRINSDGLHYIEIVTC